jgi:hypothetical protein
MHFDHSNHGGSHGEIEEVVSWEIKAWREKREVIRERWIVVLLFSYHL